MPRPAGVHLLELGPLMLTVDRLDRSVVSVEVDFGLRDEWTAGDSNVVRRVLGTTDPDDLLTWSNAALPDDMKRQVALLAALDDTESLLRRTAHGYSAAPSSSITLIERHAVWERMVDSCIAVHALETI